MMRFPIKDLLNQQECYQFLQRSLYPEGLSCPSGHPLPADQAPHSRQRAPIVDYKCRICGKVYHLFTNTVWSGTHYDCATIVLILRGFAQGVSTQQLADELHLDYKTLLNRRHQIQKRAQENRPDEPLDDMQTEADEMYQNAGEKGDRHDDADDPPRRRANKRRGRGTKANDRPPILGVVGRDSKQLRLTVTDDTQQETIEPLVEKATRQDSTLYTDEHTCYHNMASTGRLHMTVCHGTKQWARDADGDGKREVHCNTLEGLWTGLRNFLRPFRGVHKKYLAAYVAIFEWTHNLKRATSDFLSALMIRDFTYLPT